MIYSQKINAQEQQVKYLEGTLNPFAVFLLRHKANALMNRILIPDKLISELEEFTLRNNVAKPKGELHTSCPHCLKAHAIKTAMDLELDEDAITFIDKILEGNKDGHDGYYLDDDVLIKL